MKEWSCKFSKSLQQTTKNSGAFSVFTSHRILNLVSNCENLCSASLSLKTTAGTRCIQFLSLPNVRTALRTSQNTRISLAHSRTPLKEVTARGKHTQMFNWVQTLFDPTTSNLHEGFLRSCNVRMLEASPVRAPTASHQPKTKGPITERPFYSTSRNNLESRLEIGISDRREWDRIQTTSGIGYKAQALLLFIPTRNKS